jgi:hypothetical protein
MSLARQYTPFIPFVLRRQCRLAYVRSAVTLRAIASSEPLPSGATELGGGLVANTHHGLPFMRPLWPSLAFEVGNPFYPVATASCSPPGRGLQCSRIACISAFVSRILLTLRT